MIYKLRVLRNLNETVYFTVATSPCLAIYSILKNEILSKQLLSDLLRNYGCRSITRGYFKLEVDSRLTVYVEKIKKRLQTRGMVIHKSANIRALALTAKNDVSAIGPLHDAFKEEGHEKEAKLVSYRPMFPPPNMHWDQDLEGDWQTANFIICGQVGGTVDRGRSEKGIDYYRAKCFARGHERTFKSLQSMMSWMHTEWHHAIMRIYDGNGHGPASMAKWMTNYND